MSAQTGQGPRVSGAHTAQAPKGLPRSKGHMGKQKSVQEGTTRTIGGLSQCMRGQEAQLKARSLSPRQGRTRRPLVLWNWTQGQPSQ